MGSPEGVGQKSYMREHVDHMFTTPRTCTCVPVCLFAYLRMRVCVCYVIIKPYWTCIYLLIPSASHTQRHRCIHLCEHTYPYHFAGVRVILLFKIVCPEKVVDNGFVEKFHSTGPVGDVGSAVLKSLSLQIYIQHACSGAMNLGNDATTLIRIILKKHNSFVICSLSVTNVYLIVESQRTLRDDIKKGRFERD